MRFRFRLVSPRAAAHVWGKGARILTEINRLTQLNPPLNGELRPESRHRSCWKALMRETQARQSADLPAVLFI